MLLRSAASNPQYEATAARSRKRTSKSQGCLSYAAPACYLSIVIDMLRGVDILVDHLMQREKRCTARFGTG